MMDITVNGMQFVVADGLDINIDMKADPPVIRVTHPAQMQIEFGLAKSAEIGAPVERVSIPVSSLAVEGEKQDALFGSKQQGAPPNEEG